MIPDAWYVVLESKEVKSGRPTGVTRLGKRLVFWRDREGTVHCLHDLCAHRGAALSAGKACSKHRDQLECPFHGFRYGAEGQCRRIPANGKKAPVPARFHVTAYPAREAHGFIWLWWGTPRASADDYPPLPFFEDIDAKFTYKTYTETWPVHYSRAIENQLDAVHLPFVHRSTIGRANHTLVHGPLVEVGDDPDEFLVWVRDERDDGQTRPMAPEEFTEADKQFHLHFKFPHLWQNYLGDKVRVFIAFVPVDDAHTRFYMRFYQKFLRVPGLRHLVNWLGIRGSRVILHQDRRVVVTQRPIASEYAMKGENLIQGDGPIVHYRRRRHQLKERSRVSAPK